MPTDLTRPLEISFIWARKRFRQLPDEGVGERDNAGREGKRTGRKRRKGKGRKGRGGRTTTGLRVRSWLTFPRLLAGPSKLVRSHGKPSFVRKIDAGRTAAAYYKTETICVLYRRQRKEAESTVFLRERNVERERERERGPQCWKKSSVQPLISCGGFESCNIEICGWRLMTISCITYDKEIVQ